VTLEGRPFAQAIAGVMQAAPHANAARLLISYLFSRDAQQILVDAAAMRSLHPDVTERPGRLPLAKIKLLKTDPAEQLRSLDEVKQRYARYFGT
jgi:iron(III) transport system substrate-binding protein